MKPAEELEKIWDNPGPASRRRIAEDVTLAGFESEFRGELPADHLLEDQPSTLE